MEVTPTPPLRTRGARSCLRGASLSWLLVCRPARRLMDSPAPARPAGGVRNSCAPARSARRISSEEASWALAMMPSSGYSREYAGWIPGSPPDSGQLQDQDVRAHATDQVHPGGDAVHRRGHPDALAAQVVGNARAGDGVAVHHDRGHRPPFFLLMEALSLLRFGLLDSGRSALVAHSRCSALVARFSFARCPPVDVRYSISARPMRNDWALGSQGAPGVDSCMK